jgi:hypothetical protein
MKGITGGFALLLVFLASDPTAAQQRGVERIDSIAASIEDVVDRSGIITALDSLAAAATPELERSLEQLAQSLEIVRSRIANDPELRASAIRAAQGLTDIAQVVVVEQSRVLQELLRAAADRLAELSAQQDTIRTPY